MYRYVQGGGGRRLSRSTESSAIHLSPSGWTKSKAFTMAEILLSLTIIGVVAAITLPSLTGNINERTWNTQRKALYARFSQAFSLMPSLNGYGSTDENAAETFISAGLSKVLKINNICNHEHLTDCGIVSSYIDMAGNKKEFPKTIKEMNDIMRDGVWSELSYNTYVAAFETQNGGSVAIFYNPGCSNSTMATNPDVTWRHFPSRELCVNFVYDLNGSKGPNTFGKDMGFITVINATDSIVVAPTPESRNANITGGSFDSNGSIFGFDNAPQACSGEDVRLPNIYELMSMLYNKEFLGLPVDYYWSSSMVVINGELRRYSMDLRWMSLSASRKEGSASHVRCVKR